MCSPSLAKTSVDFVFCVRVATEVYEIVDFFNFTSIQSFQRGGVIEFRNINLVFLAFLKRLTDWQAFPTRCKRSCALVMVSSSRAISAAKSRSLRSYGGCLLLLRF